MTKAQNVAGEAGSTNTSFTELTEESSKRYASSATIGNPLNLIPQTESTTSSTNARASSLETADLAENLKDTKPLDKAEAEAYFMALPRRERRRLEKAGHYQYKVPSSNIPFVNMNKPKRISELYEKI